MSLGLRCCLLLGLILSLSHCVTLPPPVAPVEAPVSRPQQLKAQEQASIPTLKTRKRKVAIARFSNETRYGRTLTPAGQDPLEKQASDMLASRLVASQQFLVFERPDLSVVQREQARLKDANLVGVDVLILGSITEFGRATTGESGFLSKTKKQTARAKVEIRLVDARTGHAFFSAMGSGEASTATGEIAGFGSVADYDATLNDRAIGAAISDVQNSLLARLQERPWRTDVLKVEGQRLFISGGERQGIRVGDTLVLMRQGERLASPQTGLPITLPGQQVGQLRILSVFGDSELSEGALGELLSGAVDPRRLEEFYVAEEPGK